MAEDRVKTKMVATPMLTDADNFWDTPKNGQSPKKRTSTKLLTKTAPIKMYKNSIKMLKIVQAY